MSETPQSPDAPGSGSTDPTAPATDQAADKATSQATSQATGQATDQATDQWFSPADDERPAEYDRISAHVDELTDRLAGAEPEQVGTELADLHERADAIGDPEWRDQAHTRVDELPEQVSAAADQSDAGGEATSAGSPSA